MQYSEIAEIAETVLLIRPEWTKGGTINALTQLPLSFDDALGHAIKVAQNPNARTPAALSVFTFDTEPDPVITGSRHGGSSVPCDICGCDEWGCQKAQENQTKIGNEVHDRHPGRQWPKDWRHDYAPRVLRPATIMGEERAVTIETLRRKLPKARPIPDHIPYVPPDLLGESVAGRATGDDQEAEESPS